MDAGTYVESEINMYFQSQ